jgi:hypothetical protein
MTPQVTLISTVAAFAAWQLSRAVVRRPVSIRTRVEPYTAVARQRLGTLQPETIVRRTTGRPGFALVFGPIVRRLADALARVVDASSSGSAELRLRQAGLTETVEQHRTSQLGRTAGATAIGALMGLMLRHRSGTVIILAVTAGFWGATRARGRIDRLIDQRKERLRRVSRSTAPDGVSPVRR